MDTVKKSELSKALQIGSVCVGSYMVSYYMRNVLSVTSPEMLNGGFFSTEFLGTLSSVYMLLYAIGQLFNGIIGDIVKPKLMICGGMLLSGLASILFSFANIPLLQVILFAIIGFSLSMLRGPLVKTISENTSADHSRILCTFFSFAGFSGPLIASLISMFCDWRKTFIIAGAIAIIIGVLVYVIFTAFEKNGRLTYAFSKKSEGFKNIFKIFTLKNFLFYLFVGAIAEIFAASIGFWTPTYFTQKLGFTETASKAIFSAMSFIRAVIPFVTLFLFKAFKEKDIKIVRFAYLFAILFLVCMFFSTSLPYINVVFLILANLSIAVSSSLLWSIYIPSQRESGMVSTVNGFLDFSGYAVASGANILFAHAIGGLGWNGIIGIWTGIVALGAVIAFLVKQK